MVEQDPVQRLEEPEGTKLIVPYGNGRLAVLLPRLRLPSNDVTVGIAHIKFEVMMSCGCGRADCWASATPALRTEFRRCVLDNFTGPQFVECQGIHEAFVGLMTSILRAFVQKAMN